jgi:hypothetical protein
MGFLSKYQPFRFPLSGTDDSPEVKWTFRVMTKAEKDQFLQDNKPFVPEGAPPPEPDEGASELDVHRHRAAVEDFERAARAKSAASMPEMTCFTIEWVAKLTHDVEGLREDDAALKWPSKADEQLDMVARLTTDTLFGLYAHMLSRCAGLTASARGN